ncbi:MAG TPA: SCP2 sterol-binding domain-containing protein [Actinomycetota bacterium]|jgi:putative sterol carrier protein|nr:SCP2 sterol-binding domain-containing protein [Actinomycetota bacterium]
MALKFLSEEWAKEVTEALNASDAFKQAAGTQTAKIQNVVTTPEGESKTYLKVEGGQAEAGVGDIDAPDATITQDYETAVALWKNELTATAAYMSGKIKVSGDLMKLMQMQGIFGTLPAAISSLDVEY